MSGRKRELEAALEEATSVLYDVAWHMDMRDERHFGTLTAANNAHTVLGKPLPPFSTLSVQFRA